MAPGTLNPIDSRFTPGGIRLYSVKLTRTGPNVSAHLGLVVGLGLVNSHSSTEGIELPSASGTLYLCNLLYIALCVLFSM